MSHWICLWWGRAFFMSKKLKSFYFRHDENAASDIKIMFLRSQLAMEGYGVYWFILEQLSLAGGRMQLSMIPMLANIMQTTSDKAMAVIKNYDLFVIDGDGFFSERMNKELESRGQLSDAGRQAGLKSAESRKLKALLPTTVQRPFNDISTTVQPEENRIEENSKEEKKVLSTSVDDVPKNEFENSILEIIREIKSEHLEVEIRPYKITNKRTKLITNRKKEFDKLWPGRNFEKACQFAFRYKAKEWFGTETFRFFEPETLLSEKFTSYVEKAEQDKGEPYVPKPKGEDKPVYRIPQ